MKLNFNVNPFEMNDKTELAIYREHWINWLTKVLIQVVDSILRIVGGVEGLMPSARIYVDPQRDGAKPTLRVFPSSDAQPGRIELGSNCSNEQTVAFLFEGRCLQLGSTSYNQDGSYKRDAGYWQLMQKLGFVGSAAKPTMTASLGRMLDTLLATIEDAPVGSFSTPKRDGNGQRGDTYGITIENGTVKGVVVRGSMEQIYALMTGIVKPGTTFVFNGKTATADMASYEALVETVKVNEQKVADAANKLRNATTNPTAGEVRSAA